MTVALKAPAPILLSHSAIDGGLATLVGQAFQRAGMDVVDLQSEVTPGSSWTDAIRARLQSASALVLLLTQSSLRSNSQLYEAGAAMALGRPVYVVYDGISAEQIPFSLQQYLAVPLARFEDLVAALQRT